LTAVALPFKEGYTSLGLLLFLLAWLLLANCQDWRQRGELLRTHGPALAVLALCLWLVAGLTWSVAPVQEAWATAQDYHRLLFIPVFAAALAGASRWRLALLGAVSTGLLAVMAISYARFLILMALLAFAAAHAVASSWPRGGRWRWVAAGAGLVGLLATLNLFFLSTGRAGYVVFAALAALWLWQRAGQKRGRLLAGLGLLGIALAAVLATSPTVQQRLAQGWTDLEGYSSLEPARSSLGLRLEFWQHTWALIAERPLTGYGTGGWGPAYAEQVTRHFAHSAAAPVLPPDAHSDYLMLAAQLGLGGLLLWLVVLGLMARASLRLPSPERWAAQGVLLAMTLTSLFNTSLTYAHEGKVYLFVLAVAFAALPARDESQQSPA